MGEVDRPAGAISATDHCTGHNRAPRTGGWGQPALHLQSTEYLTDRDAKVAEHNEYFAFGETWIDERNDLDNDGRQDYLFTGKELDPGTNLYYLGARYYDPKVSPWESADPVFGATSEFRKLEPLRLGAK